MASQFAAQDRPGGLRCACLGYSFSQSHMFVMGGQMGSGTRHPLDHGIPQLITKSEVVYGRDNVAPALRVLDTIIEVVSVGNFSFDATRSGMFPNSVRQAKQPVPEDEISLSSEGSEDEEDKDPAEEEKAAEEVVGSWEPVPGLRESLEGKPVFKHAVTRFLHVVSSEEGTHFRCGRRISTSYQECRGLPKVLFPVCKQCCPDS